MSIQWERQRRLAEDTKRSENAAAAFLQAFPLGTEVSGAQIIAWAQDHAGLASDLLVIGDDKKLLSLRRHLNTGPSRLAEGERFQIEVIDGKRKVFKVSRTQGRNGSVDIAQDRASPAPPRAAGGVIMTHDLSRQDEQFFHQ